MAKAHASVCIPMTITVRGTISRMISTRGMGIYSSRMTKMRQRISLAASKASRNTETVEYDAKYYIWFDNGQCGFVIARDLLKEDAERYVTEWSEDGVRYTICRQEEYREAVEEM